MQILSVKNGARQEMFLFVNVILETFFFFFFLITALKNSGLATFTCFIFKENGPGLWRLWLRCQFWLCSSPWSVSSCTCEVCWPLSNRKRINFSVYQTDRLEQSLTRFRISWVVSGLALLFWGHSKGRWHGRITSFWHLRGPHWVFPNPRVVQNHAQQKVLQGGFGGQEYQCDLLSRGFSSPGQNPEFWKNENLSFLVCPPLHLKDFDFGISSHIHRVVFLGSWYFVKKRPELICPQAKRDEYSSDERAHRKRKIWKH